MATVTTAPSLQCAHLPVLDPSERDRQGARRKTAPQLYAEHITLRVNDHKPQPQAEPRHWAHNFIAVCRNILIPFGPNTNHEPLPRQSMMADGEMYLWALRLRLLWFLRDGRSALCASLRGSSLFKRTNCLPQLLILLSESGAARLATRCNHNCLFQNKILARSCYPL